MQKTIRKPVRVSGVGLHTGCDVAVELKPAPAESGVVFRRVDLRGFEIEARIKLFLRKLKRVLFFLMLLK